MAENKMSEMIKASLEGIKDFADVETIFGKAITTPSGVTIIPVSKVSVGFATGGVDFQSVKPSSPTNFGGGSGSGVAITPVAFLTVGADAQINLIQIGSGEQSSFNRAADLIENSPKMLYNDRNVIL